MDLDLNDKVVLITGAAGTIGSAVARCLLEEGALVAMADLESRADVDAVSALLDSYPDRAAFFPMDLRDPAAIRDSIARILERFGAIDSVVNNAAVFHFSPVQEWEGSDALDHHYEVGLRGALDLLRGVWRQHPPALGGSVVNISSIAGHVGEPDAFAYSPIKAALKGLTLSCAMEMAEYGGWAVSVSPGHTWSEIHQTRAAAAGLDRNEYEAAMPSIGSTLYGTFLEPEQVARWIAIVASPLGKPMSGQDLHVTMGIEPGGFNRKYQTTVSE